jgi:hypothetical protein
VCHICMSLMHADRQTHACLTRAHHSNTCSSWTNLGILMQCRSDLGNFAFWVGNCYWKGLRAEHLAFGECSCFESWLETADLLEILNTLEIIEPHNPLVEKTYDQEITRLARLRCSNHVCGESSIACGSWRRNH